jgi:hypothetical protein
MRRAVLWFACAVACAGPTTGCALFTAADTAAPTEWLRPTLPPLRSAADAVQLQVVFVERPADDPALQHLVWQEVDQVGATPPAVRSVLADNGGRVAQCGSNLPPTLQNLLGLSVEGSAARPADHSTTRSHQLSLPSGQDSEVLVNGPLEHCRVRFVLNGQQEILEFEQTRCVLRIKPIRLQDGWVKLEITPEIHHGESRLRHASTAEGWAFRPGQLTEVRHALKFQLTLNTGELALVGAGDGPTDTVGQRFFRHDQDGQARQRLLVIRVVHAGREPSDDPRQP